ncbi:N-acetylmuramoyl-L-alanine amidase [Nevskia sp.]|uniref:N-acetylmuramoyl-L-alanine amidase n=1 Tax=Nevskia sp. TaxID=1929292 RepID=UPI003F71D6F3
MRALTGLLLLLTAASAAAAELREMRLMDGPEATRAVFDFDVATTPKLFTLANPDRVVIDFADARRGPGMPAASAGKGLVKSVRTGPREAGLRVVLDVGEKVAPQSFGLEASEGYGYRLIVDLMPKQPHRAALPATSSVPATTPVPAAAPAAPKPELVVAAASATAAAAVAAAPLPAADAPAAVASAEPVRPRVAGREVIVAVDAGHGGNDPGAIGLGGLREKDVTLAIARRLARKINAEPGMRAVLTRDSDTFIELRTRTVKARQVNADLFVSVHANAVNDRSMHGSSVYVLSERGASSEQARWIANHENAADLVGGVALQKQDDNVAAVLIDISQGATMEASFDVGSRMLHAMGRINRLQKAEVQQAGFMVLKSPDIPSVLVETAFISNPREEKLLGDPDYQDQLAESIFDGVRSYFARYRPQQIATAVPVKTSTTTRPASARLRR